MSSCDLKNLGDPEVSFINQRVILSANVNVVVEQAHEPRPQRRRAVLHPRMRRGAPPNRAALAVEDGEVTDGRLRWSHTLVLRRPHAPPPHLLLMAWRGLRIHHLQPLQPALLLRREGLLLAQPVQLRGERRAVELLGALLTRVRCGWVPPACGGSFTSAKS